MTNGICLTKVFQRLRYQGSAGSADFASFGSVFWDSTPFSRFSRLGGASRTDGMVIEKTDSIEALETLKQEYRRTHTSDVIFFCCVRVF